MNELLGIVLCKSSHLSNLYRTQSFVPSQQGLAVPKLPQDRQGSSLDQEKVCVDQHKANDQPCKE